MYYVCLNVVCNFSQISTIMHEVHVIPVDFSQSVYADIQAEMSDFDVVRKSCLTLCDLHSHTTDNV